MFSSRAKMGERRAENRDGPTRSRDHTKRTPHCALLRLTPKTDTPPHTPQQQQQCVVTAAPSRAAVTVTAHTHHHHRHRERENPHGCAPPHPTSSPTHPTYRRKAKAPSCRNGTFSGSPMKLPAQSPRIQLSCRPSPDAGGFAVVARCVIVLVIVGRLKAPAMRRQPAIRSPPS